MYIKSNITKDLQVYISKQLSCWNIWNLNQSRILKQKFTSDEFKNPEIEVEILNLHCLFIRKLHSSIYPYNTFQATDITSAEIFEFYTIENIMPFETFHVRSLYNFVNKQPFNNNSKEIVNKITFYQLIVDLVRQNLIKNSIFRYLYLFRRKT